MIHFMMPLGAQDYGSFYDTRYDATTINTTTATTKLMTLCMILLGDWIRIHSMTQFMKPFYGTFYDTTRLTILPLHLCYSLAYIF